MKKTFKALSILLCTVFVLQFPAAAKSGTASDSSDFKILGSVGGPTNAIAVSGNYVYVGKGTSVIVLENSGGSLTQAGQQLNLPSYVSDLKVQGKTLYAAVGSAGLHVMDISNPLKPVLKGVYATQGFAESLVVKENTVYLANGNEGLQIINVSNPARPTSLGQAFKGRYAFGVAVSGNNAFIAAADDGLLAVDISQPTAPRELASLDTPGVARNVVVSGQYAYVADDWKGVSVFNISNPADLKLAKTIPTAGRAHGLALDKNYLYIADTYMGVRVFDVSNLQAPKDLTSFVPDESQMIRVLPDNGMLFCVDRVNGIFCLGTSKPYDLELLGLYSHTVPIPLYLPSELIDWDNSKLIARLITLGIINSDNICPDKEMTRSDFAVLLCKALRIDKPGGPQKASFSDVPSTNTAYGSIETIVKLGIMNGRDETHFFPEEKMTYLEVTDALLGLVNRQPKTAGSSADLVAEAERLGLPTALCRFQDGQPFLRGNALAMLGKTIFEITDTKTKMTLLQSKFGILFQSFPAESIDMDVKGDYAYVTSALAGLSVVDIKDPSNPKQLAHICFPDMVTFAKVNGDYLYLTSMNSIYTVDITDPLHPVWTDSERYSVFGPPRGVSIDSGKMYIADEWGFKILSLEKPSKPESLTYIRLPENTPLLTDASSDIAVRNGIAHLAHERKGIKIYDVRDEKNIKLIGTYSNESSSDYFYMNVIFEGSLAFANVNNATEIFDISNPASPNILSRIENIPSSQFNYRLGIYSNMLLLPNDTAGVAVVDISDPSKPLRIGNVDTVGIPVNVAVKGNYAFVTDNIGGLQIISLSTHAAVPAEATKPGSEALKSKVINLSCNCFKVSNLERYNYDSDRAIKTIEASRKVYTKVLTVTTKEDTGPGSLRWCLLNSRSGDLIDFDRKVFDPGHPAVIYIKGEQLQFYDNNITIDASNAGVIIDGSHGADDVSGLRVNTSGNVIKGLKIQNFNGGGIKVAGSNNLIGGSRLAGEGPVGEGNTIISNKWFSIIISGQQSNDNIIAGNNVGVDSDGITPAGNNMGVSVDNKASRNIIGIEHPEYRNIISGNKDPGINARGIGTFIQGNYLGTDISGTKAIGNSGPGIAIDVGGFGSIVRNNVICDNREGVLIWDGGSNYNVVVSNSIGLGADGKTHIPNRQGAFCAGGGVGGGTCFNIFGSGRENLSNKVFSPYNEDIGSFRGVYDLIYNGKVCKYGGSDRY